MSSIPTTIRSLLCSWERSFPGRHTTFNVTFIAIRNHFQQQLMPNSFHIIFAFITPLMLNLIALRYQGKSITPFDTQPITMMVGISCFLAYGFELKCYISGLSPTHPPTLRRSMLLFGSLSLASFVLILFPGLVQLIRFGLYALLLMGLLFCARELRSVRRRSNSAHWLVATTTFRDQGNLLPL
jgi:hypothetical protein